MIDVGQVLDKYELLERVGQGGMAVVYRGMDRSLKRHVAVKVLHRHLADAPEARDRFEREAHAVAKLHHENILEIFAYSGKESAESYIVTEFIDGSTLKQAITDHPPRFAEVGAMIVAQICRALGHAHGQGVLHRDIKPENVMIRSDGVVKLTDFGISQMLDAQRMTVTGQLLGSPAYMSPEHVEGQQLDFRTDVFATGIVLYQLTVGKLPFEGKNPHEILKRIADCKFVDPRQANPRIGNQLGKIILRAMARSPADRYPVIGAMLADLETYLEGSGLSADKDELARYFANPVGYELALAARLTDHLTRRAKAEIGRDRAGALELLDRVLTIEPKHAGALELMASLERGQRWRRGAAAVAIAAAAGGAAWGLRRATTHAPVLIGTDDATPMAADASRAIDAPLADARALDARPSDARPAPVDAGGILDLDARELGIPTDARRFEPALRVDAGERTDAAVATFVVLRVSPPDAEISVGGGAWQRALGGRFSVATPAVLTEVAVRAIGCETETRNIGPEDAGGDVSIRLGFLPATVVVSCADPSVQASVNGVPTSLGDTKTIPFGNTTITSKTVIVEFTGVQSDAGPSTRRKPLRVDYGQSYEVRCDD